MALPNPGLDFTALQTLSAAELDQLVANIEALADGTAFEAESIPVTALDGEIPPSKLNPVLTLSGSNATITPTADIGSVAVNGLASNTTIATPTGSATDMQGLMFRIKDDGTARTITWSTAFVANGVTLPTTTTIGKTLYVQAIYNASTSKWDIVSVSQEF